MTTINLTEPAVRSYVVYSSILALKVLSMVFLTARYRFTKKVFANEEDAKLRNGIVKLNDPDVERVRRAHLNDLENIPVFWILGALYLTTSPDAWWAVTLFRIFTAGRFLHTFFYVIKPLPQPARFISFAISKCVMWYMGIKLILYYISAL